MKKIIFTAFIALSFMSCTENERARAFGGNIVVQLNSDEELVNCTWKESSLWILTKNKTTGAFVFREDSPYGMQEGKVTFK